jgi:predicted RNA-binding protein with PUA-like domain
VYTARVPKNYWLVKTEPNVFSFDDLMRAPRRTSGWDGVRNYQARNFLRSMKQGDGVLVYHSSTDPKAVAGTAEVAREAYPDPTQFDAKDDHYDPDSSRDDPRWSQVDLRAVEKLPRPVTLDEMKAAPELRGMRLLQRGNRLSVLPVTEAEFRAIVRMGKR